MPVYIVEDGIHVVVLTGEYGIAVHIYIRVVVSWQYVGLQSEEVARCLIDIIEDGIDIVVFSGEYHRTICIAISGPKRVLSADIDLLEAVKRTAVVP